MTFFLDTDMCIYALKGRFPSIAARLVTEAPQAIRIASIVKAECVFRVIVNTEWTKRATRAVGLLLEARRERTTAATPLSLP